MATVTIPAVAKPPAKKKPFPWWIIAVAGGVLVLVIGVIIAVVVMSGGPQVPKVIGLDYAAAVAALKEKGYTAAPEISSRRPARNLWARCSCRIPRPARRSIPRPWRSS